MKKCLSLLLVFCLILSGCGAAKDDDATVSESGSQSQEQSGLTEAFIQDDLPRPDFRMKYIWGGEEDIDMSKPETVPVDLLLCVKGGSPFFEDHLKRLEEILIGAGLPKLRISLVYDYEVINEALLNAISQDLGKNWDLLYFEESALGNAKMEELFMPLSTELSVGGLLEDAYMLLPPEAWEVSRFSGENYSVAQIPPVTSPGITITPYYLDILGMQVDQFYRQDPFNLDELGAEIYEANENHVFMEVKQTTATMWDYFGSCYAAGMDISPYFTMLYPYIGIEAKEGGSAVSILESEKLAEAAESMQRYVDLGYAADKPQLIENLTGMSMGEYYGTPDYDRYYEQFFYLDTAYGTQIFKGNNRYVENDEYYQVPMGDESYIMMKQQRPMLVVSAYSQQKDETLRLLNFLLTNAEAQQQLAFYDEYATEHEGMSTGTPLQWFGLATIPVLSPTPQIEKWYPCLEGIDLYESMKVMYSEAKMAPGTGFMFDPEPVIEQIRAVETVMEDYDDIILSSSGAGKSTSLYLWEMRRLATLEDLQEAGLQDIVDEINRQMQGE